MGERAMSWMVHGMGSGIARRKERRRVKMGTRSIRREMGKEWQRMVNAIVEEGAMEERGAGWDK